MSAPETGPDGSAADERPPLVQRIPWLRLAAEFGVVFLGVTVGLLADDWRESRGEREFEVAALEGVLSDLDSDAVALGALREEKHQDDVSAMWVRENIGRADVAMDSAAARITNIYAAYTYEPSRATYAGLRSSGRLSLIRDDELRGSIVDYYENLQPNLMGYVEGYDQSWFPLRRALSRDWILSYPPGAVSYDLRTPGLSLQPLTSWDRFPSDPELSYYLNEVGVLASVISRRAGEVEEASGAIQAAIRTQLGR